MTDKTRDELRENIKTVIPENLYLSDMVLGNLVKVFDQVLEAEVLKAEELMGEAVIARMRQANFQWEKADSFINSYQLQKEEDVHGVFKKIRLEGKK